jgi:hypothetical protein
MGFFRFSLTGLMRNFFSYRPLKGQLRRQLFVDQTYFTTLRGNKLKH